MRYTIFLLLYFIPVYGVQGKEWNVKIYKTDKSAKDGVIINSINITPLNKNTLQNPPALKPADLDNLGPDDMDQAFSEDEKIKKEPLIHEVKIKAGISYSRLTGTDNQNGSKAELLSDLNKHLGLSLVFSTPAPHHKITLNGEMIDTTLSSQSSRPIGNLSNKLTSFDIGYLYSNQWIINPSVGLEDRLHFNLNNSNLELIKISQAVGSLKLGYVFSSENWDLVPALKFSAMAPAKRNNLEVSDGKEWEVSFSPSYKFQKGSIGTNLYYSDSAENTNLVKERNTNLGGYLWLNIYF